MSHIPDILSTACPGCGLYPATTPCSRCTLTPSGQWALQRPDRYNTGVFAITAAGAVLILAVVLAKNAWQAYCLGLPAALLMAAVSVLALLNLRSTATTWRFEGAQATATFHVDGDAVLHSCGTRRQQQPLPEDLSLLAGSTDAALAAGLARVLKLPESAEEALPVMMALARAARRELSVTAVNATSWVSGSDTNTDLADLVIDGMPDGLGAPPPLDITDAPGADDVVAWLNAHPRWITFFEPT